MVPDLSLVTWLSISTISTMDRSYRGPAECKSFLVAKKGVARSGDAPKGLSLTRLGLPWEWTPAFYRYSILDLAKGGPLVSLSTVFMVMQ